MNKRYFTCPPDSGVFVGLDKLTPREVSDSKSASKSPKRDENAQANFESRLMPSFLKGNSERKLPQERINHVFEIDQRVVTFIEITQPEELYVILAKRKMQVGTCTQL